jgi:hypothetical protein
MHGMLIAWDANGEVVATLDALVQRDGDNVYLVNFEQMEAGGLALVDTWNVETAVGSGHWPEWLGAAAHDYKVELGDGPQRIKAQLGQDTGARRERTKIDNRNAKRRAETPEGEPVDLRSIVGGPNSPVLKANRRR